MRQLTIVLLAVFLAVSATSKLGAVARAGGTLSGTGLTHNEAWVSQVYLDLLHRPVSSSELDSWVNDLNGSTTEDTIVNDLESGATPTEYENDLCKAWFPQFLHRAAGSSDLSLCDNALDSGTSDEGFIAFVVGSAEYFMNRAGSNNSTFVYMLFADLLNRAADPSSLSTDVTCLNNATCTRTQLAQGVLGSFEYEDDLCTSWFVQYLHRNPGPDLNGCANALHSGVTDEQFIAALLSSTEYNSNEVPSTGFPALEGSFSGVIGSFSGADPFASDYTASISWGDGNSSAGTIVARSTGAGGGFYLVGSDTYGEEATDAVSVTIKDVGPSGGTASLSTSAIVHDAPLTSTSAFIKGNAGTSFSPTVASFSDPDPAALASDFTTTVDWGDGSSDTSATVSGTNPFSLTDSHTYASAGYYAVKITITDAGGASTTVTDVALISNFSATGLTHNEAWVSQVYLDLLHRPVSSSELDSWVNDLNGSTTEDTIVNDLESGATPTEYENDLCKAWFPQFLHRAAGSSDLSLCDNALDSGTSDEGFIAFVVGSAEYFMNRAGSNNSTFVYMLFADLLNRAADPSSLSTDVTCLNNATCTRTQLAQGVLGSFEYEDDLCTSWFVQYLHRNPGPDLNGCANALHSGVTDEQFIAALLSSTEYNSNEVPSTGFPALEGSFSGVIGSFSGADPFASDYTASISWGDGNSSAGTIVARSTGAGGGFYLVGSDTYGEEATDAVSVTIKDVGPSGGTASLSTSAIVHDAPLSSAGYYAVKVTITDAGGAATTVTDVASIAAPSFAAISRLRAVSGPRGVRLAWRATRTRVAGYRLFHISPHGLIRIGRPLLLSTSYLDRKGRAGERYQVQAIGLHGQVVGFRDVTAIA